MIYFSNKQWKSKTKTGKNKHKNKYNNKKTPDLIVKKLVYLRKTRFWILEQTNLKIQI